MIRLIRPLIHAISPLAASRLVASRADSGSGERLAVHRVPGDIEPCRAGTGRRARR